MRLHHPIGWVEMTEWCRRAALLTASLELFFAPMSKSQKEIDYCQFMKSGVSIDPHKLIIVGCRISEGKECAAE